MIKDKSPVPRGVSRTRNRAFVEEAQKKIRRQKLNRPKKTMPPKNKPTALPEEALPERPPPAPVLERPPRSPWAPLDSR